MRGRTLGSAHTARRLQGARHNPHDHVSVEQRDALHVRVRVFLTAVASSDNPSKRYFEERPRGDNPDALAKTLHVWCSVMSLDGQVDIHATHSETCDAADGLQAASAAARLLGERLGEKLLHKGA